MRSRMPPCPGKSVPESFTSAERFNADSARSPICAAIFTIAARADWTPDYAAKMVEHRLKPDLRQVTEGLPPN